jgi:geranylgeranyl pyrophosphate synthase
MTWKRIKQLVYYIGNFLYFRCILYSVGFLLVNNFYFSQRALAEVTEMIRTSHLVHKGLVNIYSGHYPEPTELNDVTFGNKIALLSGDYLLGNSCAELANLRNQDVRVLFIIYLFIKHSYYDVQV